MANFFERLAARILARWERDGVDPQTVGYRSDVNPSGDVTDDPAYRETWRGWRPLDDTPLPQRIEDIKQRLSSDTPDAPSIHDQNSPY